MAIECGDDALRAGHVADDGLLVRCLRENLHGLWLAVESGRAFFHAGGDFFDCGGATERADVIFKQLADCGQVRWKFRRGRVGAVRSHGSGSRSANGGVKLRFTADQWNRQRVGRAAMAGVAGDFAMALEIILVQREHHFHHVARDLLGFLVVLFEVTFDVAEATFDAERRGDELHRGNQLPGRNAFKDFDIFVHLVGGFTGVAVGGKFETVHRP